MKKLINPKNKDNKEQAGLNPETQEPPRAETKAAAESNAETQPVEEPAAEKVRKPFFGKKEKQEKPAPEKTQAEKTKLSGLTVFLVVFCAVLILGFMGMTLAGYKLSGSRLILPNVYANGIDVGGMTVEQAETLLFDAGFDKEAEGRLRVKMPMGANFKLQYKDSGAKLSSRAAAEIAFEYGHSGNWYADLFKYLGNLMMPVDIIYFDKTLNYEYINAAMDEAIERFEARTADTGYDIDLEKGELRLLKGAGEMEIDKQALYKQIVDGLLAGRESITYTLPEKNVSMPDFEKIAGEINTECESASFDENFEIKPSVTGVHLNAGEAKKIWREAKLASRVLIPISITPPEVSTEDLRDMLFRDRLGSQTTSFKWSSENRINNIKLVSDKLNGLIMMPGDVFSFNGYIGERTVENGFKAAGAYLNGLVVEEVGGGICQVSSTLYCASMLAQMETVERTCHYFMVDYLSPGLDATVSWPNTDFKFKNCREYPIKIVSICDTEAKTITVEFWGTDTDGTYVELTYSVGTWYDETYPTVAIGKLAGSYRIIYDKDGNMIDQIAESYSAYHFHPEEIQWPEEKEEEEEVPTEPEEGEDTGGTEPSPTPTPAPDPGTGDNSGDNMEDEDGNITFG